MLRAFAGLSPHASTPAACDDPMSEVSRRCNDEDDEDPFGRRQSEDVVRLPPDVDIHSILKFAISSRRTVWLGAWLGRLLRVLADPDTDQEEGNPHRNDTADLSPATPPHLKGNFIASNEQPRHPKH